MFLYTHIEKCAGTTFNSILGLTFPRYVHITKNPFGGNEQRNDLTLEQYKKIRRYFPSGIGGHSVRPYIDYPNDGLKITFLRNPLERYISQMNHHIETGWSKSFDDFVQKDLYKNFMTKKMAGADDLNKASSYLDEFDFIGDANKFATSLLALQDVLDIKFYGDNTALNVRKKKENYIALNDLSPKEKRFVEAENKNDILIYEKFILKSNALNGYGDSIHLKTPSALRRKVLGKLNRYKKIKLVNPIRANKINAAKT